MRFYRARDAKRNYGDHPLSRDLVELGKHRGCIATHSRREINLVLACNSRPTFPTLLALETRSRNANTTISRGVECSRSTLNSGGRRSRDGSRQLHDGSRQLRDVRRGVRERQLSGGAGLIPSGDRLFGKNQLPARSRDVRRLTPVRLDLTARVQAGGRSRVRKLYNYKVTTTLFVHLNRAVGERHTHRDFCFH